MAQIQGASDLSNIKDDEEFKRFVSTLLSSIVDIVNGKLEFEKNIKVSLVNVNFPTANTDVAIVNPLNTADIRYIIVHQNGTGVVYAGTAATIQTIYLRSSVAMGATILFF